MMHHLNETIAHLPITMEVTRDLEDKVTMAVVEETIVKVITIIMDMDHLLDENDNWWVIFLTIWVREHLTSSFRLCKK